MKQAAAEYLSKAFDRVDWDALWDALRHHGVSEHIIWILQVMYHDQTGLSHDASKSSREFLSKGSVRQGCVLSPRLFCAVLQVALANWRAHVEHRGVDMNDGLLRLLDLRFANDLLFASTSTDASYLLNKICAALRAVGLALNATKTGLSTSETQAPHQLVTPQG